MTRRKLWVWMGGLIALTGCKYMPISTQLGNGTEKHPFEARLAHGHLDEVYSNLLYARLQLAAEMNFRFPGYSHCGRCQFPWAIVRPHSTWYEGNRYAGSGIFALCSDCWVELQSPEQRLPYYRELFENKISGWKESQWELVKAAVLKEKRVDEN